MTKGKLMYKITLAYDNNAPHWQKDYANEFEAWKDFFAFTDWGFANEYSTVNLYNSEMKCFTKIFYREERKVVEVK
jgi:hypothetical protein